MSAIRSEPPAFVERRQFLTFRLGGRTRGLDSTRIVRVAEIHHVTPLPSDLRCNLGLVTHRGVVAGLMDLELLEAQSTAPQIALAENRATSTAKGSPEDAAETPNTARSLDRRGVPEGPFFCIFARFPGGVAGFAIDELLQLRTVSMSEDNSGDPAEPAKAAEALPFEIVELDTLQIFQ